MQTDSLALAPGSARLLALARAMRERPDAGEHPLFGSLAGRAALAGILADFEAQYHGVDVGLVTCPPWSVISPHIGVAYLIGFLRARGLRVTLFDMNIDLYHALQEEDRDLWQDLQNKNEVNSSSWFSRVYARPASKRVFDEYIERIVASRPKVLGFSVIYRNTPFANEVARLVRQRDPGILTLAGGPETTTCYKGGDLWRLREIMPHVDCFAIGEGEVPLYRLAVAARKGLVTRFAAQMTGTYDHALHSPAAAARDIPGILVVQDLEHFTYEKAEIVEDIDHIPTPDYDDFDKARYAGGVWPFLFSRGCILKCAFCLSYATFGRFRSKTAQKNFDELKAIIDKFQITNFEFNDLEVNGDLEALEEFCDRVVEAQLPITWFGYFVARKDMTQELFNKIRAAGCYRVRFGGESGSTRVLKLMNKALTREVFLDNVRMSFNAGMQTTINIIVGFPGETEETFVETLDFVRETAPWLHHIANVSMCTMVPNSDLSKNPKKYGVVYGDNLGDAFFKWRTEDGTNTFEVRLDRMVRTLQLCRDLGIYVDIANWEISDTSNSAEDVKEMMRWYRDQNALLGSVSPTMRPHPDSEVAQRQWQAQLGAAQVRKIAVPPRPEGCCGNGCPGCSWAEGVRQSILAPPPHVARVMAPGGNLVNPYASH